MIVDYKGIKISPINNSPVHMGNNRVARGPLFTGVDGMG